VFIIGVILLVMIKKQRCYNIYVSYEHLHKTPIALANHSIFLSRSNWQLISLCSNSQQFTVAQILPVCAMRRMICCPKIPCI